jgi:hypothetical protein
MIAALIFFVLIPGIIFAVSIPFILLLHRIKDDKHGRL